MRPLLTFLIFALFLAQTAIGQNLIQQGIELSNKRKYREALPVLQQATEQYPDSALGFDVLGTVALRLMDTALARVSFDKAISLFKDDFIDYSNKGLLERKTKEYEKSVLDYNRAIEIKPNDAYSYDGRANTEAEMGRYTAALDDYQKAIDLEDSSNGQTFYNRGIAYDDMDNDLPAIKDYTKALSLSDTIKDAYFHRAIDYDEQTEYNLALQDFASYIKLDSKHARVYKYRAATYIKIHNYPAAISDYKSALKLNPADTICQEGLVYAYYYNGNCRKALKYLTKLLAQNPNDCDYLQLRAEIHSTMGKPNKVKEDMDEAAKHGCSIHD
jgi:tetratricopeptide (TPR) repeat protein